MTRYTADAAFLETYLAGMYSAGGLKPDDSATCSSCTVLTDLWGVDSHGLLRTPAYLRRIRCRAVNPAAEPRFVKGEEGPLALMDGDAGMGYVVGRKAMEAAIGKARSFGFGMVLVSNSNHFGAAALYARQAAAAGMLGIAATNVIPNIAMPGSRKPVTGNNPLALAAPIAKPYPFSLDISMSAVSGGKLLLARKKGEKIPLTWAVDSEGRPTDDPAAGFAGILLPVGMHKGLGLSLFIDIMTGVLSGGPFLQEMKSMYRQTDEPSLTSHLFCVIDPAFFMEPGEFNDRMARWTAMLKATPMTDPGAEQVIPGEIEYLTELRRRSEGIPVPEELAAELRELEEELGMDLHLELQAAEAQE